ncbi:hypothetical protein K438DRAFT_1494776, partial [Mycena galopus ATCC 62051]
LHRFRNLRNVYLGNMLRRDGCLWPHGADHCASYRTATNAENPKIFRCKQCYGDELLCADCMVTAHTRNPLHRIEVCHNSYLKTLGLRVQLGHPPSNCCSTPVQLHAEFMVIHTNGIHEVAADACDCEHRVSAGAAEEQLLRAGWFPAT